MSKELPCIKCKEWKALQIIKDKAVNVPWIIMGFTLQDYNKGTARGLTEEEYDLLQEILL